MTFIISYRTSLRSGLFETMILQHNTITKSEVRDVYSYQGQCLVSMHSDGIWNVYVNACGCQLLIPLLYCFDFIEQVVGPAYT